jgi:hypothetical protein
VGEGDEEGEGEGEGECRAVIAHQNTFMTLEKKESDMNSAPDTEAIGTFQCI